MFMQRTRMGADAGQVSVERVYLRGCRRGITQALPACECCAPGLVYLKELSAHYGHSDGREQRTAVHNLNESAEMGAPT